MEYEKKFTDMLIIDMPISARTKKCLISEFGEGGTALEIIETTDIMLLKIPGFGRISFNEMYVFLINSRKNGVGYDIGYPHTNLTHAQNASMVNLEKIMRYANSLDKDIKAACKNNSDVVHLGYVGSLQRLKRQLDTMVF